MTTTKTNKKHVHYETNTIGRDLIVGDIHGCVEDLLKALVLLNFNQETDRLFSVGDLIDRGPDSITSAELIFEPWFYPTKGNHEDLLVISTINKSHDATECWLFNGGIWSISTDKQRLEDVANKMSTLPLIISVGTGIARFNIVHAELAKRDVYHNGVLVTDQMIDNWEFTSQQEDDMMWGRGIVGTYQLSTGKTAYNMYHDAELLSPTYVGHTPQTEARRIEQQIYIDTGAVYYHTSANKNASAHLTIAEPGKQVLHKYFLHTGKLDWLPLAGIPTKGMAKP